jgi:hypothetical protein
MWELNDNAGSCFRRLKSVANGRETFILILGANGRISYNRPAPRRALSLNVPAMVASACKTCTKFKNDSWFDL